MATLSLFVVLFTPTGIMSAVQTAALRLQDFPSYMFMGTHSDVISTSLIHCAHQCLMKENHSNCTAFRYHGSTCKCGTVMCFDTSLYSNNCPITPTYVNLACKSGRYFNLPQPIAILSTVNFNGKKIQQAIGWYAPGLLSYQSALIIVSAVNFN